MRPLVYVSDGYPTLSQTFTLREVRGLRADGIPLEVLSMHPPGPRDPPLSPDDDPVVTQMPGPFSPAVLAASLAMLLRRPARWMGLLLWALRPHTVPWRADLQARAPVHLLWAAWVAARLPPDAHVHAQFVGSASNVAWMAARLADATFSMTAHAEWGLPLLRPKLRDAAFVLSISEFEKQRLLAQAPPASRERAASRVIVSRLGVDLAAWRLPPPPPSEDLRVLAVGMLGEKKGHDVLVEAVALARQRGVKVRADIVGEGPERARLEALIARLGVTDHVRLLGAQPASRVRELLQASDVGALACRATRGGDFDGIPVALMEAMASERPVVTCAVSAIPELVEDGVSGLVVPPDRPDLVAEAIARLASDAGLRARLGAAARARVGKDYDAEASRRRVTRIFRAYLAGQASEPLSA